MKSNRNYLKICIFMFVILGIGALYPKIISFAGTINSEESRVIAAASGTFSYDGKTYRADQAYINSLTSYLSGDDVDLTAAQADKAISKIYSSVADGVARGYLYEISSTPQEEATTETSEEVTTETSDNQEKTTTQETTASERENDSNDKNSSAEKEETVPQDEISEAAEITKKLEQRPSKEDADVSVEMEKESVTFTTKGKGPIRFSKTEQMIPQKVILIIDGIAVVLLGITIICCGILIITKCMVFKKHGSRKARPGHSKRRKIRHYTRAVLTVTTAVCLIGILLLSGIRIGLFDKNAIMQNMQSSGYFRYAYSEYLLDMADELYSNYKDGDSDIANLNDVKSYEEYLFTIKQNSVKVLEGNTDILIPDSNVTPYIYNLKTSYNELFSVAGIIIILNILLGILFMIYMDARRERGIKHVAVSVLLSSICMIFFTVVMAVGKPYLYMYIEPDYLYLFLMECIKRCVMVMICVTAFSLVIGMILIGVYRNYVNNKTA